MQGLFVGKQLIEHGLELADLGFEALFFVDEVVDLGSVIVDQMLFLNRFLL